MIKWIKTGLSKTSMTLTQSMKYSKLVEYRLIIVKPYRFANLFTRATIYPIKSRMSYFIEYNIKDYTVNIEVLAIMNCLPLGQNTA